MKKISKKFWALVLVISTFVAFAAMPVSAEEQTYNKVIPCNPSKTDAYDNTFTPGFTVNGEGTVLNFAETHGTIRTFTHTLSSQIVYVLSVCTVNYDDAEHNWEREGFYEILGLMSYPSVYFINDIDNYRYSYNKTERCFMVTNNVVRVENIHNRQWLDANATIMLSNASFVNNNSDGLFRLPSTLGTFRWTGMTTRAAVIGY